MGVAGITKCRRVCCDTRARKFTTDSAEGFVRLTVEELESLRLCDFEGAEQGGAALSMGVSRGTLQRIVYSARRKVAEALCAGLEIRIGGGYFSPARNFCGGAPRCSRCRFTRGAESDSGIASKKETEEKMMKDGIIAVTAEDGQIVQQFGHTRAFELYEFKNGAAVSHRTLGADGSGHSALGGLLRENGVNLLICGGIGGGAKNVLAAAGIELISGVCGPVDEAVELYLKGRLVGGDPSAECAHHHEHEEHECCGRHGHGCK